MAREISIDTRRRHTSTSWRVQNRNDPLSKLEIGSIHASVKSATRDLTQLNRNLALAKNTMRTLKQKRQSLLAFIASERALLSPIRALPRELLAEIFVHHCAIFAAHKDCITASLAVSQVCRGWRTAAHATPVLWTRFLLYYCPRLYNVPGLQNALYRGWLQRAGSLSCDVALREAPPSMVANDRYHDDDEPFILLDSGGFYSSPSIDKRKWRMLDMVYGGTDTVCLSNIAAVRTLIIHIPHPGTVERRRKVVEHAKHLEEVKLRCPPKTDLDHPVSLPILPLQAVRRCEMDGFPFTNGLQILHDAKALETLKWTTAYCDEVEEEDRMLTVTTNIHTLDLSIWGTHDLCLQPLFNNLTAPQLATLRVAWKYRPSDEVDCEASAYWYAPAFLTFLTRSTSSLTSLTLLHADIEEADLIELLEHTPLLEQLHLSDRYARRYEEGGIRQMLGGRILARLAGLSLAPKLRVLELRGGFEGNDLCDADILHVFEARFPFHREAECLTRGALHILRRADQQPEGTLSLAERAARLRDRGLAFEFTTGQPDPDDAEEDPDDASGSEEEEEEED